MNASIELMNLQTEQLHHDEFAHKDILCLPIQTRIKHMVLHFSKYVGRLIEAREVQSHELLISTLVDTWIIVLASANMLNIRLSDKLNLDLHGHESLNSIGEVFASLHSASTSDPFDLTLFELGKITGKMAKACESLDHMEKFASREALEQGVLEIARLSLAVSTILKINVSLLVSSRWKEVERKSIFYRPQKDGRSTEDIYLASRISLI